MIIRVGRSYTTREILRHVNDRDTRKLDLDGHLVSVNSTRILTFKRSLVCVECGLVGTHFWKEKHHNSRNFHLNLYANNHECREILMTKDHVIPKSLGGRGGLENLQTMCVVCNNAKGSFMPEIWKAMRPMLKTRLARANDR